MYPLDAALRRIAAAKRIAQTVRDEQPGAAEGAPEAFASQMLDDPADLAFNIGLRVEIASWLKGPNATKNNAVLAALRDLKGQA